MTILQSLTVSQRIPQNFKGKPLNYLMDTQITYLHKSLEDRDEELWYVLARILKGLEDGKPVFSSGTGTLTYNLGLLYNLLLTLPVPIPDEEKKLT